MITVRDKEGDTLALVLAIEDYAKTDKFAFFSEPEESLQVGSLFFPKNSVVEPHIHRAKKVGTAYPIVELILILSGAATVDIYDEKKNLVRSLTLNTGTMLLLKRGGHGFRFPDGNAQILDIRCGPYVDKVTDKEMIW